MENIELSFYFLLFTMSVVGFFLFRNQWVYRKTIECIDNDTYHLLPDDDYMFYRFWVWDIEKFKQK